ncbi:MAG: dihydroorotase, partial [Betaproteobacteria bacterium]|nr:dihydroorotase [Betaproteobacteria bacterium]
MTDETLANQADQATDAIVCDLPDDWHLHLRDGEAMQSVVLATALQFGRAIVMPNLKPPVCSVSDALSYRQRIVQALAVMIDQTIRRLERSAVPEDRDKQLFFNQPQATVAWMIEQLHQAAGFEPLMTLYLTDQTSPQDIDQAVESAWVRAVKLYPAGATTHSDAGVRAIKSLEPVFERMQKRGLPLLIHGEVTDPAVDVFEREAVFIDRVLIDLRQQFPALRIVFEHITTQEAAEFVRDAEGPIAATITPQHLLYNRNAIFSGGLRPHWYCLPVLKKERHRLALLAAATSGSPKFFLGTDSAPHATHLKEHAAACAGCYSAPHALALYASAFEAANALAAFPGFAAAHGAAFYGLDAHRRKIRLVKSACEIPERMAFGSGQHIVPLAAGEMLPWRFDITD